MCKQVLSFLLLFMLFDCAFAQQKKSINQPLRFDFGGQSAKGYTPVSATTKYNDALGYGFEELDGLTTTLRKGDALTDGFVSSSRPIYFSVKLPDGNYDVRLTVGDKEGTSDASVRVECRRLMVERVRSKTGETKTLQFTAHVRDTMIKGGGSVRIKERERTYWHWDNKLTFELKGTAPKMTALEIRPASEKTITVFLAGNSTVVDQASDPYAAWGQIVPSFFEPGKVAVANYAESGESLRSFIAAKRFEKVLSLMKPGDYAFVEFGHNDQKQKGEGIGAFTSYKKDLLYFISEVKRKGGHPVLVTSMQRRSFDSATGKILHTLGDYPEAVRQTAKEQNLPLIDLNAQSKIMYEAWGIEASKKAFVIYPANTFPGQKNALNDNTHFNPYGAYEIARLIAQGIRDNHLALTKYLKKDLAQFHPSRPDPFDVLYWPMNVSVDSNKPDGN